MQQSSYSPRNSAQIQLFLTKIISAKTRQDVENLQKGLPQFEANSRALECLILPLIQRTNRENTE